MSKNATNFKKYIFDSDRYNYRVKMKKKNRRSPICVPKSRTAYRNIIYSAVEREADAKAIYWQNYVDALRELQFLELRRARLHVLLTELSVHLPKEGGVAQGHGRLMRGHDERA